MKKIPRYLTIKNVKKSKVYPTICEMCGVRFQPYRNNQKFCGSIKYKKGCSYKNWITLRDKATKAFFNKEIEYKKHWNDNHPHYDRDRLRKFRADHPHHARDYMRMYREKIKTAQN